MSDVLTREERLVEVLGYAEEFYCCLEGIVEGVIGARVENLISMLSGFGTAVKDEKHRRLQFWDAPDIAGPEN